MLILDIIVYIDLIERIFFMLQFNQVFCNMNFCNRLYQDLFIAKDSCYIFMVRDYFKNLRYTTTNRISLDENYTIFLYTMNDPTIINPFMNNFMVELCTGNSHDEYYTKQELYYNIPLSDIIYTIDLWGTHNKEKKEYSVKKESKKVLKNLMKEGILKENIIKNLYNALANKRMYDTYLTKRSYDDKIYIILTKINRYGRFIFLYTMEDDNTFIPLYNRWISIDSILNL